MNNKNYQVIAKGSKEDFIVTDLSLEEAEKKVYEYKNKYIKGRDLPVEMYDYFQDDPLTFQAGCAEKYQCYIAVPVPQSTREKIKLELELAQIGLTQYSFDLMDTDVCDDHIAKAIQMLSEEEQL